MSDAPRLVIMPRSRLETVFRTVDPDGYAVWHVFTDCADRRAPFHKMLGTCMQLHADGTAIRHTERIDDVHIMEVMPPIGEK